MLISFIFKDASVEDEIFGGDCCPVGTKAIKLRMCIWISFNNCRLETFKNEGVREQVFTDYFVCKHQGLAADFIGIVELEQK